MKRYKISVNGQSYDVQVEELGGTAGAAPVAAVQAAAHAAPAAPVASAAPAASGGAQIIKSPMPGTLMTYRVAVGQAVHKGEVVLILEAMKMENEIVAPADGTVKSLGPSEGAAVNTGDILLTLA